jgi:predicted 3-demethylubiquinone-9 3-methyltransferase (glyoxalase superfamily)
MGKITPFLWFDNQLGEALDFYKKVFKDFEVMSQGMSPDASEVEHGQSIFLATWKMNGQDFMGMNAGPTFKFTEAISFYIDCDGQEEVDYYWDALLEGGEASQCGWLKDRFGLSWQVVPKQLNELMADPNPDKAKAVTKCMLGQQKIIVSELQAAHDAA